MSNRVIYNVQYNIPRYNLSLPGRQNRSGNGIIRITPGLTEILEFNFGNVDGVPLILIDFTLKFVVWHKDNIDTTSVKSKPLFAQSDIVLTKKLVIDDPYEGKCYLLLTEDDTFTMQKNGSPSLTWTIFMINGDGQVFPAQVTSSGERTGRIYLDKNDQLPSSEIIRSL